MHQKKSHLIAGIMILIVLLPAIFAQAEEVFKEINRRDSSNIPDFLHKRITVDFREITLVEALMAIAEAGGFHINFNRSQMSVDKMITLKRKEESAFEVLLSVLKDSDVKLLTGGEKSLIIKPAKISRKNSGIIKGRVIDSETQIPLIGTNIILVGKGMGGSTDENGRYFIRNIPKGKYKLVFSYIGYEDKQFNDIEISPKKDVRMDVQLKPAALQLKEIVITPGKFAVMGREPIVKQTLTKQNLETVPFGEDIYRAITRLPGVTAGDYTAKFMVRGGKNEEILTLMDGLELYEPFHLKDVEGGIISIIDVNAIEGIDLYTGGFPAQYGEYLSGVLNMKSASPGGGQSQTSLGISFMNAKFMSEGSFNRNKGSWLVSARRGYVDLVLKLMDEKDPPLPKYFDTFAKVKYQFGKRYTLSASMIHSLDKLDFVEEEAGDVFDTRYGNSYGWVTLNSIMNPRLLIKSLLSFGRITHNRRGIGYFDDSGVTQYTVDDQNRVNIFSLKQDWDFELSQRWFLKWGFYYNYQSADYDYVNSIAHFDLMTQDQGGLAVDTNAVSINPKGERFGGYFSNRLQVFSPLNIELGLRYDRNGYTADRYVSPRVNFVYAFGKQTFLRGGWGHFNQSQRMHEIKVAYGETDFFPTQKSRHWVLGLEHTHRNGLNLRLEAYYKKISQLRPDYRIFSNDIEVFPEVQEDGLFALNFNGARSKGLEVYLKYDEGGKFSCWTSYALAYAHENVHSLIHQGEPTSLQDPVVPNRYDQRHTVYLDFNYRPNRKWHLNISWQYHTGWPYTQRIIHSEQQPDGSIQYIAVYDKLYGAQLPAYHRLDIQINRHFFLSNSQITLFLAMINLYNHENIRNIKYSVRRAPDGIPYLVEQKGYWFPLLPSLGVSWTWRH